MSPREPHCLGVERAGSVLPSEERRSFATNEDGAAAVEFGLLGGFVIMLLLAAMDFGFALFQHNQASKAVQLGARLAAVTDPVSSDLATFDGTSAGAEPGAPMPYFERRCRGATETCTNGTFDRGALHSIVYGRGNTACQSTAGNYPAMCRVFPRIRPENLEVDYVHSGIGIAGVPGIRPTPTITVRVVDLNYRFMVLGSLLGLGDIPMAGLLATATGEDLAGR